MNNHHPAGETLREWASYFEIAKNLAGELATAAEAMADALDGKKAPHLSAVSPIRSDGDPPHGELTPQTVVEFQPVSGQEDATVILASGSSRPCVIHAIELAAPPDAVVTEVRIRNTIVWEGVEDGRTIRFAPFSCAPGMTVQVSVRLAEDGRVEGYAVGHFEHFG